MLEQPLAQPALHAVVREAVDIERSFVCDALPVDLIGMNSRLMVQYIEFVADRLLSELGAEQLYGSTNPFDWMDLISMQGKTNFFERRVGEYQKAGVMASANKHIDGASPDSRQGGVADAGRLFALDEDF